MTIGLLHGYHLEGSGSNLWTRYLAQAYCRQGRDLHLICQEGHPENFPFISEAYEHHPGQPPKKLFQRKTPFSGRCTFHHPIFEGPLPVYVGDYRSKHSRSVPMPELSSEEIESYLEQNLQIILKVVQDFNLTVLHANHTVLMSVVAQRLHESLGIPYAVMPHGSALEYVVKRDPRYFQLASPALEQALRIFVVGPEMKQRLQQVFPSLSLAEGKFTELNLGVDTVLFQPIAREKRKATIGRLIGEIKRYPPAQRGPDPQAGEKLKSVDWDREKILLFIGALIPNKGVRELLQAWPEISSQVSGTRLLVVGQGPLREELEPTVPDSVLFLGYLPHSLLRHLYPCADLLLIPSTIPEAGPLVFFEAMASGCFPLGTHMGGMGVAMDKLSRKLPSGLAAMMKLNPNPKKLTEDLMRKVPAALSEKNKFPEILRSYVLANHDWNAVARLWGTSLLSQK